MAEDRAPRRDLDDERSGREVIAKRGAVGLSVRASYLHCELSEVPYYAWQRELTRRNTAADEGPRFAEVVVRAF